MFLSRCELEDPALGRPSAETPISHPHPSPQEAKVPPLGYRLRASPPEGGCSKGNWIGIGVALGSSFMAVSTAGLS